METPLGVAGARARNSVGSSDWQALCDLEAELEAELRDEVTRSSERSRRKRAEGNGTSWDSPGVSSGPPTRARASTERPASSRSSPTASSSPGYRLRRQPHPSWAPSASQTPASASSPGADRSPRASRWSTELGVVLDGFGRPMLPLDTSASFARPGRAPLRERETKTWAETTPAVASAVPAARRERLDRLETKTATQATTSADPRWTTEPAPIAFAADSWTTRGAFRRRDRCVRGRSRGPCLRKDRKDVKDAAAIRDAPRVRPSWSAPATQTARGS